MVWIEDLMNESPFGLRGPSRKGVPVTGSNSRVLRYVLFEYAALLVLGVGCQAPISPVVSPTPSFAPIFTYSTHEGAIWQIDADGHREIVAAADGALKPYLTWSPDYDQLAYVIQQFAAPNTTRTQSLYMLDAKGGSPRKLAGPFYQLDYVHWSDAHHIQMQATDLSVDREKPANESPRLLLTIDTRTSLLSYLAVATRKLPTEAEAQQSHSQPNQSPNGIWSVTPHVEGTDRVFDLVDAAGKDLGTIYRQPSSAQVLFQSWSPDSRWLVYRQPVGETYLGDLYVYDPLTLSSRRLTSFASDDQARPLIAYNRWSPDSKWLLFQASVGPINYGLCIANPEQASTRCFAARWKYNHFVWDRHSEFVAFVGQVGEPSDLYVIDVRKGELRNLTNNGDSEREDWIIAY